MGEALLVHNRSSTSTFVYILDCKCIFLYHIILENEAKLSVLNA